MLRPRIANAWGTVHADIASYASFYPGLLDGLFIDEMPSLPGFEAYYVNLTSAARELGFTYFVGNPGEVPDASYFNVGIDTLIVYENAYEPTDLTFSDNSAASLVQRAVIPYNVSSLNVTWVQQAKASLGWIYVTDQTLPNPWGALPAYFQDLVAALVV